MATSFKSYLIGFIVSFILTIAAYFAVVNDVPVALWVVTGLAMIQFTVQIVFFLHLGQGKDRGLNIASFALAFAAMFILIAGSLWITKNLNYNHNMSPGQMEDFIMHDEGIQK